jgi:uncharacterized membrane protein
MCYRDHRGRDRMVVRFTTTYAISVYHLSSLLKVALNTINLNHSNMCYMMDATSEAEISRPLSVFAIAFCVLLRLILFWHFHTFGKEWRLVVTCI